jgi:thymidylate kinase
MGVERMHSPKYWLMRAEEFRTKADNCEYKQTRDSLRKVAENYQTLARQAQRILDAGQANERRRLEALQATQEPGLILSGSHAEP